MNVIVHDPYITQEHATSLGTKLVPLDELLSVSDFVTLHVPLTDATKKMMNKDTLSKMKPEACLINTSRGKVIDEEALYQVLKEKRIKGAALDVYEKEPLPHDSKLLELKNIVLTPHLGASTEEAQVRIARELSHAVVNFFENGIVLNGVNIPSIDISTYHQMKPYIELSEKIGKLQAVMCEGAARQINLTYSGEILNYNLNFLTLAFLRGFLGEILDTDVNYVNSLYLAKSRGINVREIKSTYTKNYISLFSSVVETEKESSCINGTVFVEQHLRITEIKGIDVDVRPEGHMLILTNIDKPGIIGAVGSILGKNKINIASMEVGRKEIGGEAITILNVDSEIDHSTINELKKIQGVLKIKTVKL
jgi:D-3-phosphoglycerate dehydrogenase